jgi:hypothetical protein
MPVASGQTILASHYNAIRTKIYNVIGPVSTGYGYTGASPSLPVIVNDTVLAADWLKLLDEVNRCIVHQTNANITFSPGITLPAVGQPVYATFVNALETQATIAETNRTVMAAGQALSSSANASSTRTGTWGSDIVHEVTYTWPDADSAQYFFNLGGRIEMNVSYSGSTGSPGDLLWISIINALNAAPRTNYGITHYSTGATLISGTATSGANSATIRYTRPALNQVRARVEFVNASNVTDLNVTCVGAIFYSRGDLGGIAATPPSAQVTIDLQSGGAVTPPAPAVTRILSIPTTISAYSFQTGAVSASQTITLSNLGNTELEISDITFTSNGGVTSVPGYSWGPTPVTTINSGSSKTFTLAYTGNSVGSFNNSFTVLSNNDAGAVSRTTSQTVSAAPFDFTLSPAIWSITASDRTIRNQFFAISPVNGGFSSYTASLSGSGAFSLTTSDPAGPRVTFTPGLLSNGVYSTTLSVTVNSITKTANVSVTLAAPTTQNLGTWISAQAEFNSVIGMSYDLISGVRYLTLGIGMNADGVGDLSADGGGYALTSNLGASSDEKYTFGVALYKAPSDGAYTTFLNNYGVWFRPSSYTSSSLINVQIERSYKFTVATAGNYDWEFGVDDSGYFDIDGAICGDAREIALYTTTQTGTIYLAAGEHTVTLRAINYNGPGSVGIRIRNSTTLEEVWSTLTPVRSASPYPYWSEVYRIPLTNGATTYYSYEYCVKDYSIVDGTRYGDHFGTAGTNETRSIFTVVDDGVGNLSISINTLTNPTGVSYNDTTMINLGYAVYYYENLPAVNRYTQLGSPLGDGSQTEQFLGFNADGTVRTSLVTYPGYGVVPGGGGGGYNPIIGGFYRFTYNPFTEQWEWVYDYDYTVNAVVEL